MICHQSWFCLVMPIVICNQTVIIVTIPFFFVGSSQASYVLATLVYAAAKFDAPELIRMIFDSTSGGVVFHAYKDRAKLPESVARDHGNDDTATYLEEVTTR